MVGLAGHDPLHSLLDVLWEIELGHLFIEGIKCAVPSTVAIQSSGNVRRDELLVREVESFEDIALLT